MIRRIDEKDVISHGSYRVAVTNSRSLVFEKNPTVFATSYIFCWIFWACHLILQILFTRSLENVSVLIQTCLWAGLVAESCLLFVDFSWAFDAFLPLCRRMKEKQRPHYSLLGDEVPHADIFVTCCGEPIDVIMNTVKAAAAQDYPVSRFNVVVLDDGHDDRLRSAVNDLNHSAKDLARVHYRSRTVKPGVRSYFKAGNLNFGIQDTKKLSDGEFMASLDADMIIARDWLRRMTPHLLMDEKIGLATIPQNYYNTPKNDALAQQAEFTIWNSIFEPLHDRVGETMCMGTGFVVRRKALESIGGWPLAETGEDYMCSTKLVEKGWKIAFVRENMQHGVTPESFQSRIKQRLRWIDAAFEVHEANNWYMTNNFGEGVTLIDKASSVIFALRDLSAISTLFSLILLPTALTLLALSTPTVSLSSSSTYYYNLLNSMFVVAFAMGKLCDWIVYHDIGMGHLSNLQSLDVWSAPYCAIHCLSRLLPLSAQPATFFVTGSFICPTNERTKSKRTPLLQRLTTYGLPVHIVYVAISSTMIWYCISRSREMSLSLLPTTVLLPSHIMKLATCTWKMAVPVWYMAFPPTVPEWRDFLAEDEQGVLRPKKPMPRYITGGSDVGGLEMGHVRAWRDGVEVLVLGLCLCGWMGW